MAEVGSAWRLALPEIRNAVTGVGIWTALNSAVPVTLDGETFVLGLNPRESELAGHLRLPNVRQAIETRMRHAFGTPVRVRVISGTTEHDWETEKRRDEEKAKLQKAASERSKLERKTKSSWDGVYDQLGRMYAKMPNRSFPQSRAQYYIEASDELARVLAENPTDDDVSERSFARCIERISQYAEVPSTVVALRVLERTFGG